MAIGQISAAYEVVSVWNTGMLASDMYLETGPTSPRDPAEDTTSHQHLDGLGKNKDEDGSDHTSHGDKVSLLVAESIRCPSVNLTISFDSSDRRWGLDENSQGDPRLVPR